MRSKKNVAITLNKIGIPSKSIRVQSIGDFCRESDKDFLVSKKLYITINNIKQIDQIIKMLT